MPFQMGGAPPTVDVCSITTRPHCFCIEVSRSKTEGMLEKRSHRLSVKKLGSIMNVIAFANIPHGQQPFQFERRQNAGAGWRRPPGSVLAGSRWLRSWRLLEVFYNEVRRIQFLRVPGVVGRKGQERPAPESETEMGLKAQ